MWKIKFSREAVRDLSKLDRPTAQRILQKLKECAKDPYKKFSKLTGYDDYKLRIGDYRTLVLLLSDKTVYIERIGHRKNIYKKLKKS